MEALKAGTSLVFAAPGAGNGNLDEMLTEVRGRKSQSGESLRAAGQEFEAYFLGNLMQKMRETVHEGLFENKGGKYFYYFYDMEIGRLAAKAGGVGLSQMVEEYARHQNLAELAPQPSSSGTTLPTKGMNR